MNEKERNPTLLRAMTLAVILIILLGAGSLLIVSISSDNGREPPPYEAPLGPPMSALAADLGLEAADFPRIFDLQGIEQDWAWLQATYGGVEVTRAEPNEGDYIFRVIELRALEGPATQIVRVLDDTGGGLNGKVVCRHWPDAPLLPEYDPPASRWYDRAVYGAVNSNGDIGFGMGGGDMYDPQVGQLGASAVWVADFDGPSDLVSNLGWLIGTNHQSLIVVYSRVDAVQPPEPPTPEPPTPTPDPEAPTISEQLDMIYQELERIGDHLGAP